MLICSNSPLVEATVIARRCPPQKCRTEGRVQIRVLVFPSGSSSRGAGAKGVHDESLDEAANSNQTPVQFIYALHELLLPDGRWLRLIVHIFHVDLIHLERWPPVGFFVGGFLWTVLRFLTDSISFSFSPFSYSCSKVRCVSRGDPCSFVSPLLLKKKSIPVLTAHLARC